MSMITGASIKIASANVTPYAPKLNSGSGRRAIIAAKNGPSEAIMTHVAANGAQKSRMPRWVRRKGGSGSR